MENTFHPKSITKTQKQQQKHKKKIKSMIAAKEGDDMKKKMGI